MTQEYLVGETSVLLARLQDVAPAARAREVAALRREAEETPPWRLAAIAVRALRMADAWCWESLDCGDAAAFDCQCARGAELREFCVCARLIRDG
jgi:hypothetical protein